MQILVLAAQWGFEHLPFEEFLLKIKEAGFDGIDTWVPVNANERKDFTRLLSEYHLPIVCHQHQAEGNTIDEFCRSFEYYLNLCLEWGPVLINSHSGRDHFTIDEQLRVIDTAAGFSVKNKIRVVHETHRGRLAYSPYNAMELFRLRENMRVTADLSHWVCVTESYLGHCPDIVAETIRRTEHVHARVGYPQGPQVPDPRAAEWAEATATFVNWWKQIAEHRRNAGEDMLTITPEFGPPPYMVTDPVSGKPLADQFELNCFIKDIIKENITL